MGSQRLSECHSCADSEFLSLFEQPTPADLQRQEERRTAYLQRQEEERLRRWAELHPDDSGPILTDISICTSPPSPPPPPSVPVSASSPVECFDALIAADVSVEELQSHRRLCFDSPHFDPVQDALWQALIDCPDLTVEIDHHTAEDIALALRLFDDRLHLTQPMDELERLVMGPYRAAGWAGDMDSISGCLYDWTVHMLALAVSECNRHGVQLLDYTDDSTKRLLLMRTVHGDRCQILLEQLGLSTEFPRYSESSEHDSQHCQVCRLDKKRDDAASTVRQSI